ncbi:MAG: IMPACT family protein [Aquirufa sp.]
MSNNFRMNTMTSYLTLRESAEGLYKDKGSKFIAYSFPVKDLEEIKEIISLLKIEHPKARHVCYAYRLGNTPEEARSNDDGEPSGSAGKPILNTLISKNLYFSLVAVVRYFGGTLLGVPGLIHAYKEASLDALKEENIFLKEPEKIIQIEFNYFQLNDVMKICKKEPIKIINQQINNTCLFELSFKLSDEDIVFSALKDYI